MRYYAVKVGREIGIFENWSDAEKQVKGYSGAKYKSFSSLGEAENYLHESPSSVSSTVEAYVDGSFNSEVGVYGSGIVIVSKNKIIHETSFAGSDSEYVESYQIAGEVFAAIRAIEWAIQEGEGEITICYDFEGIRAWALNEWKTNKKISRDYSERIAFLSSKIKVSFKKIKAHSGVKFNEIADRLAKEAIMNFTSNTTGLKGKINYEESDNIDTDFRRYLEEASSVIQEEKVILYDSLVISEKNILKYIKSKWKESGKKISDVKKWEYIMDLNHNELKVFILANEQFEYIIKF